MTVRPARAEDEERLLQIDRATWSPHVSPAPAPPVGPFFNERTEPEDVLVAEIDGHVIGYGKIRHPTPLPTSDHVWHCFGLGVDPDYEGRGAGRALMLALMEEARARGGLRMTLRVFSTNERALRLYESLGFTREGLLRGEFRVADGELVDDIALAISLL